MKSFLNLLQLNFIPRSADFALLVLRVWIALQIVALHGWGKLTGFAAAKGTFPDPLGVGSATSLGLTIFAEVGCGLLIAVGLLTRFAALVSIILMSVAFFVVHGGQLTGPDSGELAFLFLGVYVVLALAGAGRFSVDRKLGVA